MGEKVVVEEQHSPTDTEIQRCRDVESVDVSKSESDEDREYTQNFIIMNSLITCHSSLACTAPSLSATWSGARCEATL